MTRGILQGTQTFGQAMEKLWVNLSIAIGNAFVKNAFDTVEKAMAKIIQTTLDTLQGAKGGEDGLLGALAKIGVSIAGAFAGSSAGPNLGGSGNPGEAMAVGGIVLGPTRAIVGEAGPEAIIPLSQLASMGLGGGGVEIRIIDQRAKGGDIETKESKTDNNRRLIEVLITDTMKGAYASGQMDRLMSDNHGRCALRDGRTFRTFDVPLPMVV
jgi:hypothetical protein